MYGRSTAAPHVRRIDPHQVPICSYHRPSPTHPMAVILRHPKEPKDLNFSPSSITPSDIPSFYP
jgi:hypothetical protein